MSMSTADPRHRTLAELNASLDHVRASPQQCGELRLIVRRPRVNSREILEEGELDEAAGLVGDTWHARRSSRTADGTPHPEMQITLMSVRVIGAICPDTTRWPLAGDQLFVDFDLARANLPPGTRLHVGNAILEITREPHTGCGKFVERFGVDAMKWVNAPEGRALNLRGIYARVLRSGAIALGDAIVKQSA